MINAMYLVIGLCGAGRLTTGAIYMNEFVPSRWNNFLTTMLMIHDGSVMILVAIYYAILPYWIPQAIYGIVFSILMLFAL